MPSIKHSTVSCQKKKEKKGVIKAYHPIGLDDNAVNEELAQAYSVSPPFRLEKFTYSNHKLMDIMLQYLSNTSFNGITVSFHSLIPTS